MKQQQRSDNLASSLTECIDQMQATPRKHDGEHCKDDPYAAAVCEGMYAERLEDVLELTEALMAIRTLCGGHDEQSKEITRIVNEAIAEHGIE